MIFFVVFALVQLTTADCPGLKREVTSMSIRKWKLLEKLIYFMQIIFFYYRIPHTHHKNRNSLGAKVAVCCRNSPTWIELCFIYLFIFVYKQLCCKCE